MTKTQQDIDEPTPNQPTTQPQGAIHITPPPEHPMTYDVDELDEFLEFVFQKLLDKDANVLTWYSETNVPAYPVSEDRCLNWLEKTDTPYSLYFATASCREDPRSGKLYNRQELFKQLHVVVLDDIGTKVSMDKIPKDLEPSYIIESSEGNYQYGFVLEEPIADLNHAKALIHLVYGSGYSDGGGCMPTKIVRLPGGMNGKDGDKKFFEVNLRKTKGPLWTPDKLFTALGIDTTWEAVKADVPSVMNKNVGTSAWSPVAAQAKSMNGIIDPVLEWLYDEKYVKSESDNWVTIKCPWETEHSHGDEAGYSPLGRGEGSQKEFRGFNCFHDGCSGAKKGAAHKKTIHDLLSFIALNGGPEASAHDPAAKLVAEWVYDSAGDCVWQIDDTRQPRAITMQAFKNTYPNAIRIMTGDGKAKSVAETKLWMTSPSRVVVQGRTFDPTSRAKLVENDRDLLVNMFHQPDWGEGSIDPKDVVMFEEFLAYLVPLESERAYFIEWLTAKCQNLGFRGAAILMIAKQQGTGRTTLSDMLETLMGRENVENVPFHRLTGDGAFNEWMEKPLVVTNETKDMSDKQNYYKVYESLKEYIDPRPKRERINPKYGQQRISLVHSSYLMFSNHDNALAVAGNDRRFYVMRNASSPAQPAYFTRLNAWLQVKDTDGRAKWARSIWRWMLRRDVDVGKLLEPAPTTEAKKAMIVASKNPVTVAIEAAIAHYPGDFIATFKIRAAMDKFTTRLGLLGLSNYEAQLRAVIGHKTEPICGSSPLKIEGKSVHPKIKITALAKEGFSDRFLHQELTKADKALVRADLTSVDMEVLRRHITDALDLQES
tara:strand:+ start:468 stop:2945 length:2478 start_codon:yes stop_codon:yes gene_type:complete